MDFVKATLKFNMEESVNHRGEEVRNHDGLYSIVSLGRGRKSAKVDCPFCNTAVNCFVWSINGGGKKCPCGAILYTRTANKKVK